MNLAASGMLGLDGSPGRGFPSARFSAGARDHDGRVFALSCPMRRPSDPIRVVTALGRFGPQVACNWSDFRVRKQESWSHLRVRCLRMPGACLIRLGARSISS